MSGAVIFQQRGKTKMSSSLAKRLSRAAPPLLLCASTLLTGCAAIVAGTAGGLIVDEGMVESDGRFDPLENTDVGRKVY